MEHFLFFEITYCDSPYSHTHCPDICMLWKEIHQASSVYFWGVELGVEMGGEEITFYLIYFGLLERCFSLVIKKYQYKKVNQITSN